MTKQTKIITVSTSKGGAGKTTTLMSLADYWTSQGKAVGMIDTDPNTSLTRWYEKGSKKGFFEGIQFKQQPNDKEIIADAKAFIGQVDILLIDVAGIASLSLIKAAGVADLVIIPTQPSEDDFLEAVNTMKIVREAEELVNRSIPFLTVLTRCDRGTKVLAHTIDMLQKIKFPVCRAFIPDRAAFQKARFNGQTPVTYEPTGDATRHIAALADEIEGVLYGAAKVAKAA